MVFAWSLPLAVAIADASEPFPEALVFVTASVARSRQSSNSRSRGRSLRRTGGRGACNVGPLDRENPLKRTNRKVLRGMVDLVTQRRDSPRDARNRGIGGALSESAAANSPPRLHR
jgi:hypothetical protein